MTESVGHSRWKWAIFSSLPVAGLLLLCSNVLRHFKDDTNLLDDILTPDAYKQWRAVALISLFASLICASPPRFLVQPFAMLSLDKQWRQSMADWYLALVTILNLISLAYHLSFDNSYGFLIPAILQAIFAVIPCSHSTYTMMRAALVVVMTPIHFATTSTRREGGLRGALIPGVVIIPLTGVVLHDSTRWQLAEAFYVNALMFVDTTYDSNALRILTASTTVLCLIAMMLKVVILQNTQCHVGSGLSDGASSCGWGNLSISSDTRSEACSATSTG